MQLTEISTPGPTNPEEYSLRFFYLRISLILIYRENKKPVTSRSSTFPLQEKYPRPCEIEKKTKTKGNKKLEVNLRYLFFLTLFFARIVRAKTNFVFANYRGIRVRVYPKRRRVNNKGYFFRMLQMSPHNTPQKK